MSDVGYESIDSSVIERYKEEVNSKNTEKVLNQCIKNLNSLGVKIDNVAIECADNQEIQCCQ